MIPRLGFPDLLEKPAELADRLEEIGLSQAASLAAAQRFVKAAVALRNLKGEKLSETRAFFVPGRIEVLGKHTDYAGGRSMVTAAEQGFCLVAEPRSDQLVFLIDMKSLETADFALDPELTPRAGHWSNYPMTVARRLARNFLGIQCGVNIAFASDLPPAAGMSSSSALIVAVFLALADVNQLAARPEYRENIKDLLDLAGYLGTVENGQTFGTLAGDQGVGTFGGSEDHTAILTAQAGHVRQYAYCPVRFERAVPLPAGYTFAVASSGVVADKTGTALEKYNAASQLASTLANLWRQHTGRTEAHLAAILATGPEAAKELTGIVRSVVESPEERDLLERRLVHFFAENGLFLPRAGDALVRGDLEAFGHHVLRSQKCAERQLGNQVPETIALAANARRLGAVAASAFGAGFGGSIWALVETTRASAFLNAWADEYHVRFPEHAGTSAFFIAGAGPAAVQVC